MPNSNIIIREITILCTTFVKTSKLLFNHSEAFATFIKTRIQLPISCQISFFPNLEGSLLQPKTEKLHQAFRCYLPCDRSVLLHMPQIPACREKCSLSSIPHPACLQLALSSAPLSLTVAPKAIPSAFSESIDQANDIY